VTRYVLVLSAGDFGETVWLGRATRHIRAALDDHVTLGELRRVWAVISPESYIDAIRENGSQIYLITGIFDTVVPPPASRRFVRKLRDGGVPTKVSELWCGHYTLGLFPFNLISVACILWFLLRGQGRGHAHPA